LDPGLIRLAQAGDVDAFTTLITARLLPMFRTATAILGHEADARDAVQGSLAAIWRGLPSLREPDRFDAWSTRILVHTCRRIARDRRRTSIREMAIDPDGGANYLPRTDDPGDVTIRRIGLERAFDRLDADQRSLLVLHHFDGLSLIELAATLGIPVGTTKSRLHAARRDLERALAREDA
jgi:RNA polymerase sigma-70 factor (ECF subfamily)